MYRNNPLFDYIDDKDFMVMPAGLPDKFYPEQPKRVHKTEDYVICFNIDIDEKLKQRVIKDYAEYYKKEKELGHY